MVRLTGLRSWFNHELADESMLRLLFNILALSELKTRVLHDVDEISDFLTERHRYVPDSYGDQEIHAYEEKMLMVFSERELMSGSRTEREDSAQSIPPYFDASGHIFAVKLVREWCGSEHPEACDTNHYRIEVAGWQP